MKKNVLLYALLLMLPTLFLTAQEEFALVGAKWHYQNSDHAPTLEGASFFIIEVVKDTLVNDTTLKMLKIFYPYGYVGSPVSNPLNDYQFIYQDGYKVYKATLGNGNLNLDLLYDFNANIGDSWFTNYDLEVIVEDIDSIQVNNTWLKRLHVVTDNCCVGYWGQIIERVGSNNYLFPTGDNSAKGPLYCYEDNDIGLYSTNIVPACDYVDLVTTGIEANPNNELSIFPNPVHDFLYINQPFDLDISILDTNGQIVFKTSITQNENSLNISKLPAGIYYVLAVNDTNGFGVEKIVKI